ncbi:MAG TPA: hypothetical protein VGB64_02185 [Actinomycetota bacterium]
MSLRKQFRIAAVPAALLVAVLAAAGPGAANDGNGCPSGLNPTWTGSRTCIFLTKGIPVIFRGAVTEAPAGSNSIRVWVSPRGYPEVVLAECRAAGTRYPACQGGFPDSTTRIDVFPASAEKPALDCNVQGTGKGTFYCQSGSN